MFDLFQKWATDEDVTSVTTPVTAGENRKCHKKNDVTTLTTVTTQEGVTCKKSANQDKTSPNQEIAPDTTKKVVTPVTVVTESATESKLSNLAGPGSCYHPARKGGNAGFPPDSFRPEGVDRSISLAKPPAVGTGRDGRGNQDRIRRLW